MWDAVIAGATGLVGLYVALRQEVRRSHELLNQRIDHVEHRLGQRIDHVEHRLGQRIDHVEDRLGQRIDHLGGRVGGLEAGMGELRADIRRLDQKIDDVRGELITVLGPRQP